MRCDETVRKVHEKIHESTYTDEWIYLFEMKKGILVLHLVVVILRVNKTFKSLDLLKKGNLVLSRYTLPDKVDCLLQEFLPGEKQLEVPLIVFCLIIFKTLDKTTNLTLSQAIAFLNKELVYAPIIRNGTVHFAN